eukprot:gene16856-biopygen11031
MGRCPHPKAPATLEEPWEPWKTLGKPWNRSALQSSGNQRNLGRTLETPWENLRMVAGDIWAEARQRAGQEQTKGNIKEIQWSEGHWQHLGIASGKPWKDVGKALGKPWETLGKTLETLGETLENPWNRPAADFWMTAAGACPTRHAYEHSWQPLPTPPRPGRGSVAAAAGSVKSRRATPRSHRVAGVAKRRRGAGRARGSHGPQSRKDWPGTRRPARRFACPR